MPFSSIEIKNHCSVNQSLLSEMFNTVTEFYSLTGSYTLFFQDCAILYFFYLNRNNATKVTKLKIKLISKIFLDFLKITRIGCFSVHTVIYTLIYCIDICSFFITDKKKDNQEIYSWISSLFV